MPAKFSVGDRVAYPSKPDRSRNGAPAFPPGVGTVATVAVHPLPDGEEFLYEVNDAMGDPLPVSFKESDLMCA